MFFDVSPKSNPNHISVLIKAQGRIPNTTGSRGTFHFAFSLLKTIILSLCQERKTVINNSNMEARAPFFRTKGEHCRVIIRKDPERELDLGLGLGQSLKHGDILRSDGKHAYRGTEQFVMSEVTGTFESATESDGHGWVDLEITRHIEDPMDFYFFDHQDNDTVHRSSSFHEFLGMDFDPVAHREHLKKITGGREIAPGKYVRLYQGRYYIIVQDSYELNGREVLLNEETPGIYLTN
jgi:hypothetical protein